MDYHAQAKLTVGSLLKTRRLSKGIAAGKRNPLPLVRLLLKCAIKRLQIS